ncbi:MAG: hypothetical protein AAFN94_10635 [Pseudomonadota bacterium]
MISRSDISGPRAGVSLFETMVALAVLSLILAVVAVSVRPPSPRLQAEAALAALQRQAQESRLRAMTTGNRVTMGTDAVCTNSPAPVFYPDGTATGGPLCLGARTITLSPLTGTLDSGS